MPLYDYICERCGNSFEQSSTINHRNDVKCSSCGGPCKRPITAKVEVFKPYWEEHLHQVPVYVRSKQHLKELCKQYGKYASDLDS